MPIYEYQCSCGWRGDQLAKVEEQEVECGQPGCTLFAKRLHAPHTFITRDGPKISRLFASESAHRMNEHVNSPECRERVNAGKSRLVTFDEAHDIMMANREKAGRPKVGK